MPLFLIPFVILAIGNTRMHRKQTDAALMEAETHRKEYELHLAEYNAAHPAKTTKAPVTVHTVHHRSFKPVQTVQN
jgi:hypothetical protein